MESKSIPNILFKFADLLGTTLTGNRLDIPEIYGRGYCKGFVFNEHIRMLISDYQLNEDIIVQRPPERAAGSLLFFKFQHVFPDEMKRVAGDVARTAPSVLIATSRVNTDEVFAIHSNTETINIEVDTQYLNGLLDKPEKSALLQNLLKDARPLLFEQLVYPSLQRIINEILTGQVDKSFQLFYLKIKAEELVCRLLMELDKRDAAQFYPLNERDIQTVYKIKEHILKHLDILPVIDDLAVTAAMSPTKLKRLFKQIFGDSIFNYYQQHRIKEAARLLKTHKITVADTGYQLGFTNMSHFSRVFEAHMGMKPKQYSRS